MCVRYSSGYQPKSSSPKPPPPKGDTSVIRGINWLKQFEKECVPFQTPEKPESSDWYIPPPPPAEPATAAPDERWKGRLNFFHSSGDCPTFQATIYIAGPVCSAKMLCSEFCMEDGFCVTVTPTSYVYSGGVEEGVAIGIINYPRFPMTFDEIKLKTLDLAERLVVGLYQKSCTVVFPDTTVYFSVMQKSD